MRKWFLALAVTFITAHAHGQTPLPSYEVRADSVYQTQSTDGGLLGARTSFALIEKCAILGAHTEGCQNLLPLGPLPWADTGGQTPTPVIYSNTPIIFSADHDGIDTTFYNLRIDNVTRQTVDMTALVSGVVTITLSSGLSAGTYIAIIQACGDGGCTLSAPLTFQVTAGIPKAPTGLRIIVK